MNVQNVLIPKDPKYLRNSLQPQDYVKIFINKYFIYIFAEMCSFSTEFESYPLSVKLFKSFKIFSSETMKI